MTTTPDSQRPGHQHDPEHGPEHGPEYSPRMNIFQIAPDLFRAMYALGYTAAQGLDPVVAELVKIRASQINKCAYCLDMHTYEARRHGERQLRIDLLNAWEESGPLYTERERAALALTEAMTVLTDGFVPDDVYAEAARHFDEPELAQLIAQIVAINAWNRFQVTTRAMPASVARGRG